MLTGKKYTEVFFHRSLVMMIRGDAPQQNRMEIRIDDSKYFQARMTQIKGLGRVISLHDISYNFV